MALPSHLWSRLNSHVSISQCLAATAALVSQVDRHYRCETYICAVQIITYCIGRAIYNLYFHPLSKYPGPKLAAITDIWWAYAR